MTVLVECRKCGHEFEIDVLHLAGQWWDQCPRCHPQTNEAAADNANDVHDEPTAITASGENRDE